ncbi:cleavage stimulation factor subunit 2 [Chironomus tepperi]|uniref:cleavage stimulation factor subunit 2 n=1 Tax=Chironomus tepperi TaxID=113505 RepID=UPI00391FAD00
MVDKNSDQSIMDKSMRSVFVGNIPYEATEEKLKDIFSEVGPVISLKLVFDRESGKPKGYGFCEYKDQETALSAMRNLNGYEIGGRTLRVDNACTEKSRMEMAALLSGPQVENPYGDHCNPEEAPEIISKTIASLPPEQMYELMKQMKQCIQNNPHEARQMLIQNPQLAYALLQAQVVMRIIDPATAVTFLFKPNIMPPVLTTQSTTQSVQAMMNTTLAGMGQPPLSMQPSIPIPFSQDVDLRADPRLSRQPQMPPNAMDMDMRMMPTQMQIPSAFDQRSVPPQAPQASSTQRQFPADPRQRAADPRGDPRDARDPRDPRDPRQKAQQQSQSSQLAAQIHRGIQNDASDQEKAALIMQVLKLTDEQIAILPAEQRASILALKEQIAKSANLK